MSECPTCSVPLAPDDVARMGVNPPPAARCYRDHDRHDGCLFAAATDRCRGAWVTEVFKPAPADEAEILRRYLP